MKKRSKLVNKIYWVFPAVGLLMAGISYPFLPERIVTHWDFSGQPDQTLHKIFLFVVPLVLGFCVFVFTWLPARQAKQKKESPVRETMLLQVLFFLLLLGAETVTIAYALGYEMNIKLISCLAIGALFVIAGNFLPKFKQNRSVGFKNSCTMNSPEVWYHTHRLMAKVMMACGACIMAAGLTPAAWSIALLTVCIVTMVVVPLVYSIVIAKRHKRGEGQD